MFGISDKDYAEICSYISIQPEIEAVILYGSRAKGNYKKFSDIDITLLGENVSHKNLIRLYSLLDDSLLAYKFDISIFSQLKNPDLIDHINRKGVLFYSKTQPQLSLK